jgi:DNA-binding transcriptional ArsR family regulator
MDTIPKADLILHPVRIRILMALSGEQKTPQQLANELRDIPQATLHRHITRLAKAGIIQVVDKRRVRGAIEKRYALDERTTTLTVENLASFSKDDHMRIFSAFIASLLGDFSRYLQNSSSFNPLTDGLAFRKFPQELSDEELTSLSKKISADFIPYANNQPRQDRRRRIFSFMILPDLTSRKIISSKE